MAKLMRPVVLLCGAACVLSMWDAPAFAQKIPEVTVVAPPVNKFESELSYRVSYADLDLRKASARQELDRRVRLTAEYVCRALREPDPRACTEEAVNHASPAVARAKKIGMTTTIKFTPGEPWTPPPGAQ